MKESTEEISIRKENKVEIEFILNQLKAIYKNLIVLKYDIGLSYVQIASILDMK